MTRYEVYVDGIFVGIVRAHNIVEATAKAKEKYIIWSKQELKVVESDD